jgi:Ca2+-binding EF-hand superfamily protein
MRPTGNLQNREYDEHDDVLRYGQPFHLGCNESLLISGDGFALAPTLYLSSTLKNERTTTRVTNKQAVYLTAKADANAIWLVTKPSKGKTASIERFAAEGSPVQSEQQFVLNHRASNTFLTTCPDTKDLTDFGEDFEVYTARDFGKGKLSIMEAEFKGTATSNTLSKANLPTSELVFVTASSESAAVDNRKIPEPPAFDDLVDDITHAVKSFGVTGIVEIRKAFLDLDRGNTGSPSTGRITIEAAKLALADRGVVTQDGYYDPIFKGLDAKNNGYIDFRDLLDIIRGNIPNHRLDFLANIFRDVGASEGDDIALDDLKRAFNPSHLPCVESGLLSESEMRNNYFGGVIGTVLRKKVKYVTFDHFVDYFADISGAVADDQYFEDIVTGIFSK